jgi:hypothetical protein
VTAELVVRPLDPLDVDEARRLVDALDALPPGVRVQVDVSALREVHPAGLAFLACALGRDGRVALRGLNRRHERLLGYLLGEMQARAAGSALTVPPSPPAPRGERAGAGVKGAARDDGRGARATT